MTEIDSSEFEEEAISDISAKRIKERVIKLSQREMRVTGSESERLTAEEIADEMRKLGLKVAIEEFETTSWEHGPAQLIVNDGSEMKSRCISCHSPLPSKEAGRRGGSCR